jgi:hypothetical protein
MVSLVNATWRARLARGGAAGRSALRAAVVILAVVAGLHAVWAVLIADPVDVIGPARSVVNKAAVVSAFAQDFVSVWLTATSGGAAALDQFVTVTGSEVRLPPTPAVVISTPTVVAVTYAGLAGRGGDAEVYSVVVGVTQRPYVSAPPARALYRVAVLWSPFGARAATLPARIGGPGPGADVALAYPDAVGPGDPAFTVTAGFLTAYLTGSDGVDRYTTSESLLVGLGAAYRSVAVRAVSATSAPAGTPAEGDTVRVLARVDAVTSQYAPTQLVYPLTLVGVGGRWCVAAVDPAPAVSTDDDLVPVIAGAGPR